MSKLNADILYLIFKELQDNKKTFLSCLTVNKAWCETIIPILWRDPWKYSEKKELLLLNVIVSHFSEESRKYLENQRVDIFTSVYQKPFFNYISFCRYLNLSNLNKLIDAIILNLDYDDDDDAFSDELSFPILRNEIINLFINENTRITHLYVPDKFDYQLHLIPGAKNCFSELEFLSCNTRINDNVLFGLTEICKSIKELELFIEMNNNNYRIVKLIESSKRLFDVRLQTIDNYSKYEESFCKIIENSLIKHADTIQYFMIGKVPITKILSSFVNLKKLELGKCYPFDRTAWNCLENLSLPFLQILKARGVPIKVLTNLIESTNGYLNEISIGYTLHNEIDNEKIIQTIYRKCRNLNYLKLLVRNRNILEFEKLLINCQYLNGLYIIFDNSIWHGDSDIFNWDYLFEILIKSSPIGLSKFKFYFHEAPKLESLKYFLDNWKSKRSISLQTIQDNEWSASIVIAAKYFDLIKEYKTQGIVETYKHDFLVEENITFEDFKWIQGNI
ncbi:hypothetical protein RclHR1_15090005 [Rhizophagus clarus]|uniref:F-box domain-containing protein n=1 Tax=Rhizophagus clarus TaxID=94130 RepID=A0A2Z6R6X3_9GLOM|nr:hypothetical protein RclHR1_15090005 [Rhizophagus clarus]GES77277.1 hypothetical protein GLOIN_2v1784962 [Rhizophagus clarus]